MNLIIDGIVEIFKDGKWIRSREEVFKSSLFYTDKPFSFNIDRLNKFLSSTYFRKGFPLDSDYLNNPNNIWMNSITDGKNTSISDLNWIFHPSYATLRDFKEFDYSQSLNLPEGEVDIESYVRRTGFVSTIEGLEKLGGLDSVRVIFWFTI